MKCDGRVVISAPISMNRRTIEAFAQSKLEWIKMQKKKYETDAKKTDRQYISGEILYFWGKPYLLIFQERGGGNSLELSEGRAVLTMRGESTAKQRETYIRERYRAMLRDCQASSQMGGPDRAALLFLAYQIYDNPLGNMQYGKKAAVV